MKKLWIVMFCAVLSLTNIVYAIEKDPLSVLEELLNKVDLSEQKVDESVELYNRGDLDGAMNLCNEAIELHSESGTAYLLRGIIYFDKENYQRALEDFDRTIQIFNRYIDQDERLSPDSNYVLAYKKHGMTCWRLKQYERAIVDFDKIIEFDLNDADIYKYRGLAYHELEQYEQAVKDYDKAIELKPNDYKLYIFRACDYVILGEKDKAQADFEKARELAAEK